MLLMVQVKQDFQESSKNLLTEMKSPKKMKIQVLKNARFCIIMLLALICSIGIMT